ncbi:MAG TPA: hypothetical protein VFH77_15615 [Streptomyces sp.]|nr:hypothetical protein [Streptomyces sp.]
MTARERLIAPAGTCSRCGEHAEERVTVALVDGGSGPGWSRRACLPCARILARSTFAPDWLKRDIAVLDAPPPRHLRSVR